MRQLCFIMSLLIAGCATSKKQNATVKNPAQTPQQVATTEKIITTENSKTAHIVFNTATLASRISDEIKNAELIKFNDGINIILDEQPGKALMFSGFGSLLTAQGREVLQKLTVILKAYPATSVKINSFMDAGFAASDMEISQRRAKAIGDFLIAKGISPHRLMIRWQGGLQPRVKGNSALVKSKNRRIEMYLLTPEK